VVAAGTTALLVAYFAFAILVLVLRYGILPHIDHYRGDLENIASHALKQRVTIASVRADWDGLRPRLTLGDVVVYDGDDHPALTLPEVGATVAWESVTLFDLRLHRMRISDAQLDIRRDAQGRFTVAGIAVGGSDQSAGPLLPWVLSQYEIVIRNAQVRWTDEMRNATPLELDELNFELTRSGTRHRFALTAKPPAALAAPLDIRGYFERELFSRTVDSDHWRGAVYANLGFVDLAGWHAYFDYPFELTHGSGALRTWVQFSERTQHGAQTERLFDVVADVKFTDLAARTASDLPPLSLASISGRVAFDQTDAGEHLSLHHFSVVGADGVTVEPTELDAKRTLDAHGVMATASIQTNRLDLKTFADLLARLPIAPTVRDELARYKPRGILKDLQLAWQGPLDRLEDFHISAAFDGLGVAAATAASSSPERPGFNNLSGQVNADQSGGSISLSGQNASLTLPGLLEEAEIPLDHVSASAKWTRQGENLEVRLINFAMDNADAQGSATGTYRHGPASGSKGPGSLDLSASLTRAEVRRVPRYLPQSIPEDVRSYLERALVGGSADEVTFLVRGALERFPYRQPGRVPSTKSALAQAARGLINPNSLPEDFKITAKLHNVKLNYAPRSADDPKEEPLWPPLEDLEADLVLERSRLEIQGKSARAYGFKLEKIHAELPDLDDHSDALQVHGSGAGPLADLLHFVNTSPVEGWLDHFTTGIRGTGPARLDLTLTLPLAHLSQAKVNGSVLFQNDDVTLLPWLPLLAGTSGELEFSDDGIAIKEIKTQFLGGPARLAASTAADHFILIQADGTVQAAALRREPNQPLIAHLAERLDGSAAYKVSLNLAPRSADDRAVAAHGPKIVIESPLTGMAIDLPPPAKKSAAESLPLRVEFDPDHTVKDEVTDAVRVRLGPQISAIFQRRQNASGEKDIVHTAYGVGEPAGVTEARAQANITLASLDLDAWQQVMNSLTGSNLGAALNAPNSGEGGLVPDNIVARVQSLKLNDKTFGNVVLNASHSGTTWQATVASDEVAGSVNWRQGGLAGAQQNRVTARLSRLVVPRDAVKDVSTLLEPGPSSLPALDITADNFELRDKKLGKLELLASNRVLRGGRREWRLEKLNLSNPDGSLAATGIWGQDPDADPQAANSARSRLDFTIAATDVGALLDRLDIKGTVKGGTSTLTGSVNWRGSPLSIDYDSLSGSMNLKASRGQFLKAEPGVAKLLGVLSLQSLTRRLSLDFSDLFSGGFAFDSIDADAKLQDGVASTSNFSMKGFSAYVSIDGSVDLAHETQNLHVKVLPQVNLGTGSIAYALLVNPVIGLGSLAIGEVLRDPLSKALAFEYNVTGPWVAPVMVKTERTGLIPSVPKLPFSPGGLLGPPATPPAAAPASTPSPTPDSVPVPATTPETIDQPATPG
jgi:uncharacterized protein YhdP